MQTTINCSENYLEFDAYRIKFAKTLWINNSALSEYFPSLTNEKAFSEHFAYVNMNSACFADIEFDYHSKKKLLAEFYGGNGIGRNGGGVRCGNDGPFQIKGTGINDLAGKDQEFHHSSGIYWLADAIMEMFNSQVFNRILPLGTVACYGVIDSGESAHEHSPMDRSYRQGILVREICARPAHYMRAPMFKPKSNLVSFDDVKRLRVANRHLKKMLPGNSEFFRFMNEFISGCAKQFSYARVFRIGHGCVSASNIDLKGRWLDLSNTTFVPGGMNYCATEYTPQFLYEATSVAQIIEEFFYTYFKYNSIDIDTEKLLNLYSGLFFKYYNMYLPCIFGFALEDLQSTDLDVELALLNRLLNEISSKDTTPKMGFFEVDNSKDPHINAIEMLFLSLLPDEYREIYRESQPVVDISPTVAASFSSMIRKAYEQRTTKGMPFKNYVNRLLIRSLRKQYNIPFFYLKKTRGMVDSFIQNNTLFNLDKTLSCYERTAEWLFDSMDRDSRICIFDAEHVEIFYLMSKDMYELSFKSSEKESAYYFSTLRECVLSIRADYIVIAEYSFKGYLEKMSLMLDAFSNIGN